MVTIIKFTFIVTVTILYLVSNVNLDYDLTCKTADVNTTHRALNSTAISASHAPAHKGTNSEQQSCYTSVPSAYNIDIIFGIFLVIPLT